MLNEAVIKYFQALRINRKLVEAHVGLGVAMSQLGLYDNAIFHWYFGKCLL